VSTTGKRALSTFVDDIIKYLITSEFWPRCAHPVILDYKQNEVLRAPRPLQICCSHFKKSAKILFFEKDCTKGLQVLLVP
jgi:hypothetical protein